MENYQFYEYSIRNLILDFVELIIHIPHSHKLTTKVIAHKRSPIITEHSSYSVSNKIYARKPSLPHDVYLGNDLIHLKIVSTSVTRGALENKVANMKGDGLFRFLASKTFIVRAL